MEQTQNHSRHMAASVASQSSPGLPQRRFDESWVELSSQPSSSSLSSIGDDIVTTGLYVANPHQRRRRLHAAARSLPSSNTAIHAAETSSQEEVDESDSDEDHITTISAENIHSSEHVESEASDDDSDDCDNATALGRATDAAIFRPQPNAFSHPPSFGNTRRHSTNSSLPTHPHNEFRRPSFSQRSQTRVHRSGPSFMSPSIREDNDAALRASLNTLLSCAHAARSLPKTEEEAAARRAASTGVLPSSQPVELRLVAESELLDEARSAPSPRSQPRTRTPVYGSQTPAKSRRSDSAGRSPRAAKKKRTVVAAEEATFISPTLMTWVVSAGVVVLVSVVGFGAGYVIGREVGRQEAQDVLAASVGSSMNETTTCGQEVMRSSGSGLRRLRWGAMGKSLVAQA
ncbi:hypothetical protein VHEMI03943 [[Torrubiella] hemipterigena]|uniref:Uncharacterized protein n=1 Tax=[Torrubiella] hemipterigena TaxID=1531966 RepID=A0A0A1TCD0_9HYPO|nr:hypothetical protein VHEMI03943 [[Torrubiella] hemipterigena]